MHMENSERISIIVPAMNEERNVLPLIEGVQGALGQTDWELIIVDDGSTDATVERILHESLVDGRIRLVALARNYGQSTAIQAGLDHASGGLLVTMDGDLQNDPDDIPALVAKLEDGYDIVAGYRVHRQDSLITRKVPSWIANWIIARVTGVPIKDTGCSMKAYRREVLSRMRLYSDMHRFIPALAAATAGARVAQVPVRHHARVHGQTKYGLSRIFKVVADLLTINMVSSFRTRPLRLAGVGGLVSGMIGLGFAIGAVMTAAQANVVIMAGAAMAWIGCGAFIVMLGLVAEVVVHHHNRRQGSPSLLVREWE